MTCYNDYDETKEDARMDLHHYGVIATLIGFLISLVWIVLDNKKFYEELDKQRYGWYNKEEEKQGR